MLARNSKLSFAISMKNFDETEWARTKSLLREHLTAPQLEHPDFVNHRVLEEIERLTSTFASGDVFASLACLVGSRSVTFCGVLTMVFLPREAGRRSDSEFISQVVSARAEMPQLSVSEFRVPDERGVCDLDRRRGLHSC